MQLQVVPLNVKSLAASHRVQTAAEEQVRQPVAEQATQLPLELKEPAEQTQLEPESSTLEPVHAVQTEEDEQALHCHMKNEHGLQTDPD